MKGKATSAKGSKFNVRWVERDAEGRPLLKEAEVERRKRASATGSPCLPRLFVITHPIFLN